METASIMNLAINYHQELVKMGLYSKFIGLMILYFSVTDSKSKWLVDLMMMQLYKFTRDKKKMNKRF